MRREAPTRPATPENSPRQRADPLSVVDGTGQPAGESARRRSRWGRRGSDGGGRGRRAWLGAAAAAGVAVAVAVPIAVVSSSDGDPQTVALQASATRTGSATPTGSAGAPTTTCPTITAPPAAPIPTGPVKVDQPPPPTVAAKDIPGPFRYAETLEVLGTPFRGTPAPSAGWDPPRLSYGWAGPSDVAVFHPDKGTGISTLPHAGYNTWQFGGKPMTPSDLRRLPADPTALRLMIDYEVRARGVAVDDTSFFEVFAELLHQPVEPAVREVLFDMVSRIDNVQVGDDVDVVGRPVVAVAHTNTVRASGMNTTRPGTVDRLMFTRDDHELIGDESGITVGKPCAFISRTAYLASGWVDHVGETIKR